MQIIVRSHLPNSLSLALNPNISVNSLKSLISDRLNICHRNFTLHHGGVLLENDCELDDYGLEDCAYLDLNCNLIGGGKKRKKKSYSTPKKIKHKRKKVDSNGKVTRLRRECPNDACGSGVFMASHFDRQYCGKCTLTYMQANK